MAHQDDLKTKIRAFYECNELSYPKVQRHFEDMGYEVSVKTIQAWGGAEKWVKNKYATHAQAVEALIPPEVLENVTDAVKQTIIKAITEESGGVVEAEVVEAEADAVGKELIWKTLNRHSLMEKMAVNLNRAENVAKVSTSIGVHATFHGMLTSAIGTLYGKKVEMVPQNPDNKAKSEKELDELSTEELLALIEE